MFKWLEKIVIKRIVKRVTNELPELKEKALKYLDENKDEIIGKVREAIREKIKEIIKKV